MTEAKTRPLSFRVPIDVLEALEQVGISPTEVAKEALRREASRARKLAALERLRKEAKGFELGFDATEFIRRDRDTHA